MRNPRSHTSHRAKIKNQVFLCFLLKDITNLFFPSTKYHTCSNFKAHILPTMLSTCSIRKAVVQGHPYRIKASRAHSPGQAHRDPVLRRILRLSSVFCFVLCLEILACKKLVIIVLSPKITTALCRIIECLSLKVLRGHPFPHHSFQR